MTTTSERSLISIADLTSEDVRAYLLEHPDFLAQNADILEGMIPPDMRLGEGVPDFQRFMLTRLQDDFVALKGEHEDLMDLMQENLQRVNRINDATLELMDAKSFDAIIRLIGHEFTSLLDHDAVGFFLEAGGWLDIGDYDGLKVVSPGVVNRWLNGNDLVLEEVRVGQQDLYGDKFQNVKSQALIRLVIRDGLPHGLLALGHRDAMYYATGIATEQVEFLAEVIERCLRKFVT